MDRRMVSTGLVLAASSCALAPIPILAWAKDEHEHGRDRNGDDARSSVTVSFGAGLNTAQPGNAANHHILPREIKVRKDGVVNFVVAGFHQPIIYFPGVTPAHIALPTTPNALFINFDLPHAFYVGIAPAGGPLRTPATAQPANASNRVESVSFPDVGDYLVICNVAPHFLDGMWAIVKVR